MRASQFTLSCRSIGCLLILSAILCWSHDFAAQDVETLPLILRYDAGGIDNIVKAIQWSPDGKTLYAAGWNKVVQVYRLDEATQQFHYLPQQNFRVPVDAGRAGIIEAMLLSPEWENSDCRWLSMGWCCQLTNRLFVAPKFGDRNRLEADWARSRSLTLSPVSVVFFEVTPVPYDSLRLWIMEKSRLILHRWASSIPGRKFHNQFASGLWKQDKQIGPPLPLPHTLIPPSTDISPRIQAWQSAPGAIACGCGLVAD